MPIAPVWRGIVGLDQTTKEPDFGEIQAPIRHHSIGTIILGARSTARNTPSGVLLR
jgi:hypothetical protein